MEWSRISISPEELGKKQQEYIRQAMTMMSRSKTPQSISHAPEQEQEQLQKSAPGQSAGSSAVNEPEVKAASPEISAGTPEMTDDDSEPVGGGDSGNYGVYTAEEILSQSFGNEEIKKAAEFLGQQESGFRTEEDSPEKAPASGTGS